MINKYIEFFKLGSEFTIDDLNNAKKNKINDIKKYKLSKEYENMLLENVEGMYNKLRYEASYKIQKFNHFDNFINNNNWLTNELTNRVNNSFINNFNLDNRSYYGESKSSTQRTLQNGSTLFTEKKIVNQNGHKKELFTSYIKHKDGTIQNIDYYEALRLK